MTTTYLNKTAFTLLEILLASIIFVVSVVGVYATLNAVRIPVFNKERQLSATILGQEQLENMYNEVDATNINAAGNWSVLSPLSLGTHTLNNVPDNQGYQDNLAWTVTCADGTTTCDNRWVGRMVNMTITY